MISTPAERESAGARQPRAWWEHRVTVLVAVLACALPLLWPDVPPLVDLPGHMGRYHVQMEIGGSAVLQSFYDFKWALIGNLGVDLLVVPLAALIGLEPAVKLITIAIPVMTGAGFLWVAREVHGRVPPTAYFALPLTYSFPFMFGFVNFALSMALAFLAFALWLRLARLGRLRLRAALFIPISVLLWVCHAFGWGTLGVMAFSAELVRQVDLKRPIWKAGFNTGLHCLALAPPMLLMLLWRSGAVGGETSVWFNWKQKKNWMLMALRDRWEYWDYASLAVIGLVLVVGLLWWKKLEYSRNLAASAIFLAIVYICLPRIVFGSNYADMRLAPFVIAAAVIAIRYRPAWAGKAGAAFAVAGLLFAGARLAGNTASFWMYDRDYDRELAAVRHIPRGAPVVAFVGVRCGRHWAQTRLEHLPAMALVRRDAFSNDQWSMSGAQLLTSRYPARNDWFSLDPSQQVLARPCRGERWLTLDRSLATFPRDKFTHVWLIRPPRPDPALLRGLQPVWQSGTSVLYRVADPSPITVQEPE
ncbi:MAG TPA: hypothetical protein VGB04_04665 [Allosphingosinicella sp.]|jgi:hypothetical protein